MRVIRRGEVARLLAAVRDVAALVKAGEVAVDGALDLVRLVVVRVIRRGEVARFLAAVHEAAVFTEGGEVAVDGVLDLVRLAVVEAAYILAYGVVVGGREVSGNDVAFIPCAGGGAVLAAGDGEHVAALRGHKHGLGAGRVRAYGKIVRRVREDGAVKHGRACAGS